MKKTIILLFLLALLPEMLFPQSTHKLEVEGLGFTLDEEPFFYTGISFFNAIYNPAFNKSMEVRKAWLTKFKDNGINVLRIWGQWNNKLGFIDTCPTCTIYETSGKLRPRHLKTLKEIIQAADELEMVVLFVFFSSESKSEDLRLSDKASDRAVELMTNELKPYRNVVFQIWNEYDHRTLNYFDIIKENDPERIVTNSPGGGGTLKSGDENWKLDFLSPHTSRKDDRHWEIAPQEIAYLIEKYQKPVVDDEPARRGTPEFGGPQNPTSPFDHILHIYNVWKAGGHIIYHHDMFQTGYGSDAIPPSGIPDPEFSPYHKTIFEFLSVKKRYIPIR